MNEEIIQVLDDMTDEQLAEIVQAVPRLCLRDCPKNESPYCSAECVQELKQYEELRSYLEKLACIRCLQRKDKE